MLILHIGTHKTGTSAIQSFLAFRAEQLRGHGIHYLKVGRDDTAGNHQLPWSIRGKHGAPLSVWEDARAELARTDAVRAVISSEAFWFTEPSAVKDQLGDAGDLRIVIYLRRQDRYLQSLYKQSVFGGRRMDFAEWLESYRFRGDYLSVVRRWEAAFGKDALHIRPYERSGQTIDSVSDFMTLLGLDVNKEFPRRQMKLRNPSPRRELLVLMRAVNQIKADIDREQVFRSVMERNSEYVRSADLLNYDGCTALLESFIEDNRTLVREYYRGGEPLFPELAHFELPEIWSQESRSYFELTVDLLDALATQAAPRQAGPSKKARNKRADGAEL